MPLLALLCFAGLGVAARVNPASAAGPPATVQFTDVTRAAGIDFRLRCGSPEKRYIMEAMCGGIAFLDYDNDGWMDIFLLNGSSLEDMQRGSHPASKLYRNHRDGTFTDVTEPAGLLRRGWGMGVAVGDYDHDGWTDLYLTYFGGAVLYRNQGDGTFGDVTKEAGVDNGGRWGTSAAFGDYDQDGDLDLYVVNYLEVDLKENPWCGLKEKGIRAYCEPNRFPGQPDALYRNEGDGRFTDVTRAAGVYNPGGKGLGVVWGDYDNDGRLDIYVANDSTENFLYHNRGDGTFEELGFMAGVAVSEHGVAENGMGTAFGDWNDDGWLDLVVTNFANQTNTLYRNDQNGFFSDVTTESKTGHVSYPFLGWAVEFLDYDNDTYLD
ncbi:MAG: VCBS repeat-containing protein, partial [Acidobacteria bacterium]|nr:VCBS repeat-containing protein [Acidobacteriota bacterium]